MKAKIQVYKNTKELQEWEDQKTKNETLGIITPDKPEEIIEYKDLWFKKSDLKLAFIDGEGNIRIYFKNEDFIAQPDKELIEFLETNFKD